MNPILKGISDFRLITLAIAGALAIVAFEAEARPSAPQAKSHRAGGTSSVQRSRGADGAVDATRTSRKGGVTTVDRFRDGSGTTDARITGPKGGVRPYRSRGNDGLVDRR
jgi:hypothetical protein